MLDSRCPEPFLKSQQRRELRLAQPGFPDEDLAQLFSALLLFGQGLVELPAGDAASLDEQLADGLPRACRGLEYVFDPDPPRANVLDQALILRRQRHCANEVLDQILRRARGCLVTGCLVL